MPYMTLLAEGAAETGVLSSDMISTMQSSFNAVQISVLAVIGIALTAGLVIMGTKLAILSGVGFFGRIAKKN